MHEVDMEDNKFSSSLGKKYFDMTTETFESISIKFKSQSEHTINGEHFDLEMQLYFRGV